METVIEKECSALGGLFHAVIGDMKSSYPVWEDFISKAGKLQSQLRATVAAAAAFLDAFQKVADLATSTRGGTRDIGSALTRMCMRHRSIEARLRQLSGAFADCLINPLQEQVEEWKKGVNALDKDHAKDYKRARQEIKKKSSDTLKLQKKAKKGKGDVQPQLDSAIQDVSDKYLLLEGTEKQALRRALVEERSRFCSFVSMLRPVVDEEISMLGEITHLQTIADDLKVLTMDPHKLPPASEQVILDLKVSDYSWSYQTPPSSPSTAASRKSSMCSSLNSVNSSDSRSSGSHPHSPSSHCRYRGPVFSQQAPGRLSSVSSHDSGFVSQDAYQSKSPSPMPLEALAQLSNGHSHYGPSNPPSLIGPGHEEHISPFPTPCFSSSTCVVSEAWPGPSSSPLPDFPFLCALGPGMIPSSKVPSWKDWAKPGPYDQPMINTLKRHKEKPEETELGASITQASRAKVEAVGGPKSGSNRLEEVETRDELALALARGLQLDPQRSSRDSLQGSSGYSTQSTTPCCSEDTIPSQVSDSDYFSVGGEQEGDQHDFDKSSTIPRTSDISQSYRRMFQAKRPASTAGLPSTSGPAPVPPGVATIRRTPSAKPPGRRAPGPIPIMTPVIPVMTPTTPEGEEPLSPRSPMEREEQLTDDLGTLLEESDSPSGGDTMLLAIRRGVKLKRTTTNDRSAPRIN